MRSDKSYKYRPWSKNNLGSINLQSFPFILKTNNPFPTASTELN